MKKLNVCVFCSSSRTVDEKYRLQARRLGGLIADCPATLVFGGSRCGCMEEVALGALDAGGSVVGVVPQFMNSCHWQDQKGILIETVATMQDRKRRMEELADVFVVLPGGLGTLDELHEVLALVYLGVLKQPVYLVNSDGFYDPLLQLLDQLRGGGFCPRDYRSLLTEVAHTDEVFSDLRLRGLRACSA